VCVCVCVCVCVFMYCGVTVRPCICLSGLGSKERSLGMLAMTETRITVYYVRFSHRKRSRKWLPGCHCYKTEINTVHKN
jgi:hypothetical protein